MFTKTGSLVFSNHNLSDKYSEAKENLNNFSQNEKSIKLHQYY